MSKISVAAIQSSIDESGLSWQAASNEFTAMSSAELKLFLGFTPGPKELSMKEREAQSEKSFNSFKLSAAGKGLKKEKAFGYPTSFDWRNHGGQNYVTPVKNQSSCGSCVAFGTAATAEIQYRIQRGSPSLAIDFSEAQLFYCHAKSEGRNCANGWWPNKALDVFKSKGVVDEACFPYTPGDQVCKTCADAATRTLKISNYKRITNTKDMKEWLSTRGALMACFSVYNDFYAYRSGVYRKTNTATYEGGHCICVVGYDDIAQCWICKNSWAASWGDAGYFRIGYGQVGIDAEMYGIEGIVETLWTGNVKIIGLWSNDSANNGWVYIQTFGWRKISAASDNIHLNLLTQCISAKGRAGAVNIHLTNGQVDEIYN